MLWSTLPCDSPSKFRWVHESFPIVSSCDLDEIPIISSLQFDFIFGHLFFQSVHTDNDFLFWPSIKTWCNYARSFVDVSEYMPSVKHVFILNADGMLTSLPSFCSSCQHNLFPKALILRDSAHSIILFHGVFSSVSDKVSHKPILFKM